MCLSRDGGAKELIGTVVSMLEKEPVVMAFDFVLLPWALGSFMVLAHLFFHIGPCTSNVVFTSPSLV